MTEINEKIMEKLSFYMKDDIRERVHFELAPCDPVEFLQRYIELDSGFTEVLKTEFSIDI